MIEKKYRVELTKYGATEKTIGFNNYQWTIYQDQIIKESALTKNFPQYFVDYIPEILEVKEEIKVSAVKEVVIEEVKPVEEVVIAKDGEDSLVEEIEEVEAELPVVEEVSNVTLTDAEILEVAKSLKTKTELEAYGKEFGVELNKQKSLKYMLNDLESFLKSK